MSSVHDLCKLLLLVEKGCDVPNVKDELRLAASSCDVTYTSKGSTNRTPLPEIKQPGRNNTNKPGKARVRVRQQQQRKYRSSSPSLSAPHTFAPTKLANKTLQAQPKFVRTLPLQGQTFFNQDGIAKEQVLSSKTYRPPPEESCLIRS